MDNHYHILLRGALDDVTRLMRKTNTSMARWYNGRHGHVGPVLQGRYASNPVECDEHLMETVRYIHMNPRDLGVKDIDGYKWSSWHQYMGEDGFCDASSVLDVFGGIDQMIAFHNVGSDVIEMQEYKPKRPYLSDAEAKAIASELYGALFADEIAAMEKPARNRALRRLHRMGISIRQMERLTGIGRGIIQPAVKNS